MSDLAGTGTEYNLGNVEYYQSFAEHYPNLVLKFGYFKDLDDVVTFNIRREYRGKYIEQVKGGVDVTTVITYKTHFAVNIKPVTVFLDLVEGVACSTIFSWPFLRTIKASIMTKKNALVSGFLGYQFNMEMMVPHRDKE